MNYYEILNLDPKASDEEIKAAYNELCSRVKEEKAADAQKDEDASVDEALPSMAELNNAYSVLSNPTKRSDYDSGFYDETRLGMKWFTFHSKIQLVLLAALYLLYSVLIFLNAKEYSAIGEGWMVPAIGIPLLICSAITIYLAVFLRKFKLLAYKINLYFFFYIPAVATSIFLGFILVALFSSFDGYGFFLVFLYAVNIAATFLYIVYFEKRKFLFVAKDETGEAPCVTMYFSIPPVKTSLEELNAAKKRVKKFAKVLFIILVASIIIFTILSFAAPEFGNSLLGFWDLPEAEVVTEYQTTDAEIENNFNEIALFFGYENYEELVAFINEDSGVDLTQGTIEEAFEYMAVEYFGLTPYDEALGLADPFTYETIDSFGAYQEYVLAAIYESEGAE